MDEAKELKDNIEIICNDKTYVSKKINPTRRALIVRSLIKPMTAKNIQSDPEVGVESLGGLFEKQLPEVMWAFIKDDDKAKIGTQDDFVENLDDKSCMKFLEWSINKINEVNSFLEKSKALEKPASA